MDGHASQRTKPLWSVLLREIMVSVGGQINLREMIFERRSPAGFRPAENFFPK
jgi:hypothetical protein